jgi:hypothetical protein
MTHKYIQAEEQPGIQNLVILHKDYNLDKKDNLDEVPAVPAVYALCGRVNGQAVNARHVACTENLQAAVKAHFSDNSNNQCLQNFMQSIKIKMLVFQLMPGSTENERQAIKQQWDNKMTPQCTDELNRVY